MKRLHYVSISNPSFIAIMGVFLSYEEKRSVCFNLRLVLLQQMPFPNVQNGQVFKPVMQGPVKQFTPGGEYCF